jgi:soluble lytic murein transglycosylase-like protein
MTAFAASPSQNATTHTTTVVKADSRTGRLVRSAVMQPKIAAAQISQSDDNKPVTGNIDDLIDSIATEQGVESQLVRSVIRAESNYNPHAVSPKGAQGIMQLIPSTAQRFGVENTFDTVENIRGGVRYLRFLLDYYQGDYARTIAAYNAGEAAVDKYNGIPPYAETQNYVFRVAKNLKAERQAAPRPAISPTAAEIAKIETTRPIETSTGSDGRIYYKTP